MAASAEKKQSAVDGEHLHQDLHAVATAELELTPSELAELESHPLTVRELFDLYDEDESGNLDIKELPDFLRALDMAPSQAQCEAIMEKYDTNKNGFLSFDEVARLVEIERSNLPMKLSDKEIRQAFLEFDTDGSGKISFAELKTALLEQGEPMEETEVDELIKMTMKRADLDGDGELNFEEFAGTFGGGIKHILA